MKITIRHLRDLIYESLDDIYQSHSDEPSPGDVVININPDCKHNGSEGVVTKLHDLPGEAGKAASYVCTNNGDEWQTGDVLTKTLDQLAPIESMLGENRYLVSEEEKLSNTDLVKGLKTGAADLAAAIPAKLNDDFAEVMNKLKAMAQFDKSKFEKMKGLIDTNAENAMKKAEKGEAPEEEK
tara:strand:- start:240 stop:785 length:546 start_codon:yes stop_codon:yes gene_type:complete